MAEPISPDYGQQFLLPPALEDWVPCDHPARFLREFVDQLDLAQLGFAMPVCLEGRPPYAPSLLLKIWLYGYFHRIRSTRKLEAACREHLPLVWLTAMLTPDHNSLWRFWRDNKKALRAVFRQTVQVAQKTGAVGMVLQAVDGTKIEAAASGYSGWSKEYMEKMLAALDKALDETELIIAQENADGPAASPGLPAGLAERQALRQQIQQGLAQLAADQRRHYHPVEPEARRMNVGGRNRFGYNAQAVADEKEGIVVACEVTREETDGKQLVPMLEQARENLGPQAQVSAPMSLADSGYGAGADLQAAQQQQHPVLVPPLEGKPAKDNPYASQHFVYDPQAQTVTCPKGQRLDREGQTTKQGQVVERYRCHCKDCPVRTQCTNDPKGRQVEIRPHRAIVQEMRERLKQPEMADQYAQRSRIIEPRFAQLKEHDGFRRWTVWGLEAVRAQWALLCTTLNLRILYRLWKNQPGSAGSSAAAAQASRSGANFALRASQWVIAAWYRVWCLPSKLRLEHGG